ncbi:hypothetical protein [Lactobacillus kitasatonis]|uniref:Uncharacterized protein n=1 Tax=Lactobacillus kitasatonis DSM 16761 = JCM 1039 TaxID=1423767 RepID=A0A0R1VMY5_9LACO|nr:hypothetical protein [Lactobacillus kitasatonis]KRM06725.1 hypothetical protein FC59_GL001642 [Lactobacillus kitasatonis DSM 16761 = JCM 1039]
MSFDLAALAKIVWIFVCTLIGLWGAGDILHDKKIEKSFASRFFEALAIVLIWVLMGLVTTYFAKFILIFIGVFIVILLIKMI